MSDNELQISQSKQLTSLLETVLRPVLEPLAELMKNNTEAIQYLAAQQKVQTDRMEALEKQIRLNTLVTPAQIRYLNDGIKRRARELLSKKSAGGVLLCDDTKAVKVVTAAIRKALLSRYGIAAMHDIPKHEYSVAMQQIATWNDLIVIMDTTREARKRLERPVGADKDYSGLVEE